MSDEPELPDEPDTPGKLIEGKFDAESARWAGKLGREKAHLEAEAQKAYVLEQAAINAELMRSYNEAFGDDGEKLAGLFKAGAAKVAGMILRGEIQPTATTAGPLITALLAAGRLEAGQVTSASRTETTTEERADALREIEAEARRNREEIEKAAQAGKVTEIGGA